MKSSSLENKTVRPGLGLDNYTGFYRSNDPKIPAKQAKKTKPKGSKSGMIKVLVAVLIIIGLGFAYESAQKPPQKFATKLPEKTALSKSASSPSTSKVPAATPVPVTEKPCQGNELAKMVLVSIYQRHMWACEGTKQVHNSPVITGIESLDATRTPTGTFKIYAKQKDVTLTGSDATGSWNDPVSYWMPYLINEFGVYGFHDATWRPNSEFGNIDPRSDKGSHGCVELPLATAGWLYNWAPVGTTVKVEA